MLQKIVKWINSKYKIKIRKLDVVLVLIIIIEIVVLLISIMLNGGFRFGKEINQNSLSPMMNQQEIPFDISK